MHRILPKVSPAARSGLVVFTLLLCVGCDSHHLTTAPPVKSDVAEATLAVSELAMSDSVSADVTSPADMATSTTLGGPLEGLDAADLARFAAGLAEFQDVETTEDGLGPVFNEASCTTCHSGPVGGTTGRAETRFGRWGRRGFDPLAELGGSLLQDHAIGRVDTEHGAYTFVPEVVPRAASVSALRITTPLFGLGLVEAVTDASLLALAQFQASHSPSTRGTPHMVTEIRTGATRVGRFGWKAQVATLHQFSGDAYLNEMGITSPDFPEENAPQGNRDALAFNPVPTMNDDGEGVERFADFMTLLGPPPRGPRTGQTIAGGIVFLKVGCANCHTPTLVTGDSPVPALAHKAFQPFSDFLLHDMGVLGDAIVQGQASGRQMRTAPLWGLSARPVFLHDGRARTPVDAILEHGGQGSSARSRFTRLDARERQALLAFLNSL
jgi:CxxC motif-containing protein (DUF1111 family)